MEPKYTKLKLTVLLVLCVFSAGYIWSAFSKQSTGLREEVAQNEPTSERPQRGERRGGDGDRPNWENMQDQMRKELGLTDEQVKKFEQAREKMQDLPPEQRREAFREMQEILTPEQQEKAREMRESMRSQFQQRGQEWMRQQEERARETLSPQDFKRYQEKREEMRKRWEQRRAERQAQGGDQGRRGDRENGRRQQ